MVIFVIHNVGIAIGKTKCYAPIAANIDRPDAFTFAFQLVQREARQIHVLSRFGLIQVGQDQAQPIGMLRLDSRLTPGAIEAFQTLVRESPDHKRIATHAVTCCKAINELKLSVERPRTAILRSAARLRWRRCSSRIGTVCIEGRNRDVVETLTDSVRRPFLVDGPVDVIGQYSVDVAIEDRESGHSPGRL